MDRDQFVTMFLEKRGFATEKSRQDFLSFSPDSLRSVKGMVNGKELLKRLALAVGRQEHITVYGDYDADGVMAACVFYMGLVRLLPGKTACYINNRFEEGYNITEQSLSNLLQRFPDTQVVLTCDNGINACEAAALCRDRGVTFLVTDHHEQLKELPDGCIAVDEKSFAQKQADERLGLSREDFCGAELARRVITELYAQLGREEEDAAFLDSLFAYAGLAAITDVVPMNAANHCTARRGIELIRKGEGPFEILNRLWNRTGESIREDTIGYSYGPMINAGGRVEGSASRALRAFAYYFHGNGAMSEKEFEKLMQVNLLRREWCREDEETALKVVEKEGLEKDPFIVIAHGSFREGINGLTAASLVNRYNVPAAVLSPMKNDPDRLKGSARAPEGFDLIGVLKKYPALISAGGHAQAAGLSIMREDLEKTRTILREEARGKVFIRPAEKEADAVIDAAALTIAGVRELEEAVEMLMPFGPGLEPPFLCFSGRIRDIRTDRSGASHAFITLMETSADGHALEVIWWRHYKEAMALLANEGGRIIAAGMPQVDSFRGEDKIRITAQTIS